MYPWIDLYFLKIPSFGLMCAISFLTCNFLLKKEFKNKNLDEKIVDDITFYAAVSAILGSKIYYVIETRGFYLFFQNIENIFIKLISGNFSGFIIELQRFGSGLVFNGGFICALLLIGFYIYRNKLDFLFLVDIISPYILLGHGIGRIGCLLVGDDYGIPSNLPWAISLPNGLPPTTVDVFLTKFSFLGYSYSDLVPYLVEGQNSVIRVHPTQIYELLLYFVGFIVLKKYLSNINLTKGYIFSFYLLIGGFSRFLVEFLRTNDRYFLNLSSAQIISITMIFIGLLLIFSLKKINFSNGKN